MPALSVYFNQSKVGYTPKAFLANLLRDCDNVTSATDANEVRKFTKLIRENLVTPLTPQQELAIGEVVGVAGSPGVVGSPGFIDGTGALAFTNMNRLLIGLQLVARVIDYNRIQQQGHSLCGPVSLMHDFAGREPVGYVQFVTGLAETRRGSLKVLGGANPKIVKVKRRSNILTKTIRRLGNNAILEADYIALASLRESASALPYRAALTSTMLQGATWPYEIEKWMTEMGYSNVSNHTFVRVWAVAAKLADLQTRFSNHIDGAINELNNSRVILLYHAGKLSQYQLSQPLTTGVEGFGMTTFGGHWAQCRDIESDPAQGVRFALDTWGQSSEIGGVSPWIPWSKVMSWYRGYVSGTP
jgi:hypothetical protein